MFIYLKPVTNWNYCFIQTEIRLWNNVEKAKKIYSAGNVGKACSIDVKIIIYNN